MLDPRKGRARWVASAGGAADLEMMQGTPILSIAQAALISYRTPPAFLTNAEILNEIIWLGDAPTWPGPIGQYARRQRGALCVEIVGRSLPVYRAAGVTR